MAESDETPALSDAEVEARALAKAKEDEAEWIRQWHLFPSVSQDSEGNWRYWDVAEDTGVYNDDWAIGERLARETVAHMQDFQSGNNVLRRIVREIDFESAVAQGFLTRIEDMLTNPSLYLDSLEPGAVRAKLRGTSTVS